MSRKYFIANSQKLAEFLAKHSKLDKKEYKVLWYLITKKEVTEKFVRQNKLWRYIDFFEEYGYVRVSNYKIPFNAKEELKKMEQEVEK